MIQCANLLDRTRQTRKAPIVDNTTRNGMLFIIASAFGYAMTPIFTKLIYQSSDLVPYDLAFWRFVLAMPVMWLLTTVWRRFSNPVKLERPLPRRALMLTGVFPVMAALSAFFALRVIDAGLYVAIFFTYPAMIVLINLALGQPISKRGWGALVMTLLGVALIVVDLRQITEIAVSTQGFVIALVNAFVIALFILINERVQRSYPPTVLASAWSITGALLFVVPLPLITGVNLPTTGGVWLFVVGLAAIATVLPYFSLIIGTRLLGSNRAAIVGTIEPIIAIGLAWIMLGEIMAPQQLLGAVLIFAGVGVLEVRLTRRKSSKVTVSPTN